MAESNVIEVKSDSEDQNSKLDMSTVGNTLTEGSSDELEVVGAANKAKRKKRWVPKLIVEKRARSSSESSDKENFSKKRVVDVTDTNVSSDDDADDGTLSPLYQNQLADPRNQFWQLDQILQPSQDGIFTFYSKLNLLKKSCFIVTMI